MVPEGSLVTPRLVPGGPGRIARARIAPRGITPVLVAVALVALALATLVPAALLAPVAHAQADGDALGLAAEAAIPEQAQAAWAPITVTVSPAVPVQGTLEVTVEGRNGATTIQREVEVAAGATKAWTMLVPPSESGATVRLQSGDTTASTRVPGFGVTTALVGVLDDPAFTDRVGAVTDAITGEVWTTVDITTDLLDLGPLAVETLGTLTAPADVLATMDDDQRDALTTAVNIQGLHLIVTDVTADPDIGRPPGTVASDGIDVLPSGWPLALEVDDVTTGSTDGAAAATTTSGRGRITWLTPMVGDDALSSPRMWGNLWSGTPVSSAAVWSRGLALDPWALQQSGVRLPSSWAMAAFAGGYLVVIGLIALVGIRRLRRRELAWLVLPVVALVLATVAFAASNRNQASPGRSLAQATWIDGVGTEQLVVLLPPELDGTVGLPGQGWTVENLGWDNPTVAVASADGVELGSSDQQRSFGAGVSLSVRSAPTPPPLDIEAVVTQAGLRAEITNTAATDLDHTRVSFGPLGHVDTGTLTAGTTVVVEMDDDGARVDGADTPTTASRWNPLPDLTGFGGEVVFEDQAGAEPMVPADIALESGTFAGVTSQQVAATPGMVWIQALASSPIVATPAGPGSADPDVIMVGVTPTVDPAAAVSGITTLWQPTKGAAHELDERSRMVFGAGTTWMSTAMPAPPAPGQVRIVVPKTQADDGCVTYDVFDNDFAQSRVEDLCDGEPLECPEDATTCEVWDQGASFCFDDRPCENWELRFDGDMAVQVWDRDAEEFRPWDDQFATAVDEDPSLVVTPLGEVVVAISGNGDFPLSRIDIGTGGGT